MSDFILKINGTDDMSAPLLTKACSPSCAIAST